MTAKVVHTFGYISIAIMAVLLALLWLRIVPDSLAVPFFIVALLLFVVRIVMRVQLARQERRELQARNDKQTPP